MQIIFTDTVGIDDAYTPAPALDHLPKWHKDTPSYISGVRTVVDNTNTHTIKKCIPVWDALTAGYVIPTFVDIHVESDNGVPIYSWPAFNALSFHAIEQAPLHPARQDMRPFPKWVSPWSIQTPPGYSCLFVPPMHNPNGIFTVMPGMVDTDSYTVPVNFPFMLDDPTWEGVIPAGTPMVQVIPFKRDIFRMKIGGERELLKQQKKKARLVSFWFNSYKRQFWTRKEYR